MKSLLSVPARLCCALLLAGVVAVPAQAVNIISEANDTFAPSFRGGVNATWFGWSPGTFFGTPVPAAANRKLDNIAPTLGDVGLADGVEFYQNDRNSSPFVGIGSSSGNLYTGQGAIGKQAAATMVVPTDGVVGTGFTTIILQGYTNVGSPSGPGSLILNWAQLSINGTNPTNFVIGGNEDNRGQWWAQFNLPGNQAEYTVDWVFNGGNTTTPISIAKLTVDSFWSATGYAADRTKAVPEPSSIVLLGLGVAGAWLIRRRASRQS